jgi:hypothetical protein
MQSQEQLFSLLDKWRHLPSYQLERRADIFFAMYLPEISRKLLGFAVKTIIPEFPVRIGTIVKSSQSNRSFKIDYLLRAARGNKVAFLELKTDMASKRPEQEAYLKAAKQAGMVNLLEGLRSIVGATAQKTKYQALIDELVEGGFLAQSDRNTFSIAKGHYQIEIVYIQPRGEMLPYATVVSFAQVARIARGAGDAFGKRFAASLETWAETGAGARKGAA